MSVTPGPEDSLPRGRARILEQSLKAERARAKRIGKDKDDKLRLCKGCRMADPVPEGAVGYMHCNGQIPSCDCACTKEPEEDE
jgi:hypothetical protein